MYFFFHYTLIELFYLNFVICILQQVPVHENRNYFPLRKRDIIHFRDREFHENLISV